MNSTKLKQFIACILQAISLVPGRVLVPTIAGIDVFCLFCKSILQEKNLQFKIILFLCKKIIYRARQATYNQLPLEERETMNFIQSILNLFGRRETKRQGKTDYKSIRLNYNAEQARILNEINKQTGKADFREYRNKMNPNLWKGRQ